MTDWDPKVVKIEKVIKHSDADFLDIVTVLGDYPIITKHGDYQVGQLAAYIPIDSIVPDTDQFYFLCPKSYEKYEEDGEIKTKITGPKFALGLVPEKYRIIKAKKIRGTYSQGMLIPIPIELLFCKKRPDLRGCKCVCETCSNPEASLGQSIVDIIPLKKWEEPEEENLPGVKKSRADQESPPKGWTIPHYDIDSVRKYINCLSEDEEIVLTEKLHGSNAAFSHDGERLWVKSRNLYKKMDPEDMWWDIALRYQLENKLKAFPHMVFFGEVVGQVKGFRYDSLIENGKFLSKIHFFDVWDTKKLRYLSYDERVAMIKEAGLSPVPELFRGKWQGRDTMYVYAEGNSTLNPKHIREGWVLNTLVERYEPRLDSRMQVKLVGEGYNLQK